MPRVERVNTSACRHVWKLVSTRRRQVAEVERKDDHQPKASPRCADRPSARPPCTPGGEAPRARARRESVPSLACTMPTTPTASTTSRRAPHCPSARPGRARQLPCTRGTHSLLTARRVASRVCRHLTQPCPCHATIWSNVIMPHTSDFCVNTYLAWPVRVGSPRVARQRRAGGKPSEPRSSQSQRCKQTWFQWRI